MTRHAQSGEGGRRRSRIAVVGGVGEPIPDVCGYLVFECTSQVEDGSVPPRVFHYHSPSLEAVLGHSSGSVV